MNCNNKNTENRVHEWSKSYPKKHADNIVLESTQRPTFDYKFSQTDLPHMNYLLSWEYGRLWNAKRTDFYNSFSKIDTKNFIFPDIYIRTKGHFRKTYQKADHIHTTN